MYQLGKITNIECEWNLNVRVTVKPGIHLCFCNRQVFGLYRLI